MTPVAQGLAPALAGILGDAGYDPADFEPDEADIERDLAEEDAALARHYADQREADLQVRGLNAKHARLIGGRFRRDLLERARARCERAARGSPRIGRAVALLEEEIAKVEEVKVVPWEECAPRVRDGGRRTVPWTPERARVEGRFDRVSYHYWRARSAVKEGRLLVVLAGPKGRGKSLIEGLLVNEFGGHIIKTTGLLDDGLWLKGGARSPITKLTKREMLCGEAPLWLDDFGQESATRVENTIEAVNELAPARVDAGRFIGMTTNLLGDRQVARLLPMARSKDDEEAIKNTALSSWMGARWALFAARMQEHGALIEVDGPNLRGVER